VQGDPDRFRDVALDGGRDEMVATEPFERELPVRFVIVDRRCEADLDVVRCPGRQIEREVG